jgi:hypothetical protein
VVELLQRPQGLELPPHCFIPDVAIVPELLEFKF